MGKDNKKNGVKAVQVPVRGACSTVDDLVRAVTNAQRKGRLYDLVMPPRR